METQNASTVKPPAGSSPTSNSPKKSGKKKYLVIAIIAAILFLSVLLFWKKIKQIGIFKSIIPGIFKTVPEGKIIGKDLNTIIDPSKTVKKMISAKEGGIIRVTTKSGRTAELNIPPGSLEEDSEIELTPAEEPPTEDPPVDEPPADEPPTDEPPTDEPPADEPPTDEPSEDEPPADEPPADDDPGTVVGPPYIVFKIPPTLTFYNNPPDENTGGTGNSRGRNYRPFDDTSVIVFVDYSGNVGVVTTTKSEDGNSIGGPINGPGAGDPTDPDDEESEDLTDNEAINSGGTCTPEFLQAAAIMMKNAVTPSGKAAYAGAIKDCLNIEWLKNLCENDRVKLRRAYFTQRLAIANTLDAEIASEIQELMHKCIGQYSIKGEGSPSTFGLIHSTVNASVCGYVDDEWNGNMTYSLNSGDGTYHNFSGSGKFNLPFGGGAFSCTARGQHNFVVVGRSVPIPNVPLGFTGNFDGSSHVSLNIYAGVYVNGVPIDLEQKSCVEQSTLPPLAPLPDKPTSSDEDLYPPLVPIPTGDGNKGADPNSGDGSFPLVPLPGFNPADLSNYPMPPLPGYTGN